VEDGQILMTLPIHGSTDVQLTCPPVERVVILNLSELPAVCKLCHEKHHLRTLLQSGWVFC